MFGLGIGIGIGMNQHVSPAFGVGTVAGLQLWLRGDHTGVTSEDDPVETWSDLSGNGRDATLDVGDAPILKLTPANNKPALLFDGTDDRLELPYRFNFGTLFAVVKYYNATFTGYDGV